MKDLINALPASRTFAVCSKPATWRAALRNSRLALELTDGLTVTAALRSEAVYACVPDQDVNAFVAWAREQL